MQIVLALAILATLVTVGGTQKSASTLHPRLNEIDAVDEYDGVIGSVKLNPSNFKQQLNSSQYNLVLFYAPWCEYCLKILPEWAKATKMMSDRFADLVRFAQVDCIAEEAFCLMLDIKDYPTIRVYTRGPPTRFELVQPCDLEDTVEYMQDYLFNSLEDSGSDGTDWPKKNTID